MEALDARVVLVAISLTLLTACGTAGTRDKAGGNGGRANPTILTLATVDTDQRDIGEFVAAVDRLSHGSLRIDVRGGIHAKDISYEHELIADARAGRYDMAQVGARAFDLDGVTTLDSLVAPFVIRSPALEERVLKDRPTVRQLLSGLRRLNLVGVALLPGDIRYLLGVSRLLQTVTALRGATIGIRPSRLAAATMQALGARAKGFVAGGTLRGLDGAEQDLFSIVGNGYDRQAKGVTMNLPLWPRSQVIAMGAAAFGRLSAGERSILARAARSAIDPATRRIEQSQRDAYRALCTNARFKLTTADPGQVARIEQLAASPVTSLRLDPRTGRLLRAIRADVNLAPRAQPQPPCANVRAQHRPTVPPAGVSDLIGGWTADVTQSRYFAAGPLPGENNAANWGPQKLTLRPDGGFVMRNARFPVTSSDGAPVKGAFRVHGAELDLMPGVGTPSQEGAGETWRYRWSLFHGTLTLKRSGHQDQPTALIAAPFKKDS
jgi:TRAP-type C4-dicarboxylate transport system substrate-binding protein